MPLWRFREQAVLRWQPQEDRFYERLIVDLGRWFGRDLMSGIRLLRAAKWPPQRARFFFRERPLEEKQLAGVLLENGEAVVV